ncbi:MAG: class I SAM-dependent rRNA methyltransferase [Bacteroidetes bacterium]|nr:class I SAM-dependent rRNA methyltransferase [Bacteroidota bacterium]
MHLDRIVLKSGRDQALRRFHPWVFSGAIARIEGEPLDGDLVEVTSKNQEFLGIGHFHQGSIAVRILSFQKANPNTLDFWVQKLQNALALRQAARLIGQNNTNCFRLAHGEGDGLPGLIIDVYGQTAVVQCHSIGMHRQRQLIAEALFELKNTAIQYVYDKSKETLPPQYAEEQQNTYLIGNGPSGPVTLVENGVKFLVDWETGQKTGFFLDQRDNRKLLQQYVPGKSVLNAFCYTGGFSAYALQAGAARVDSVDISGKAMELTLKNAEINQPYAGVHTAYTEDVLRFLKNEGPLYDVMVIDPPAYAKSLDKRHNAIQGYKRLNEAALRRLAPGGILFTFSCSQVVDRELFYHTIVSAAMELGRPASVLHHLTQGADHPVSLYHPEGSYLKGLVLFVE